MAFSVVDHGKQVKTGVAYLAVSLFRAVLSGQFYVASTPKAIANTHTHTH